MTMTSRWRQRLLRQHPSQWEIEKTLFLLWVGDWRPVYNLYASKVYLVSAIVQRWVAIQKLRVFELMWGGR